MNTNFASANRFARRFALGAGMLAASTLMLGGIASSASAQTTSNSTTTASQSQTGRGPGGPGKGGPQLTDTEKACLTGKGVTLPAKPDKSTASSTNTKPAPPTAEQKAAFETAAKACGITLPTPPADGQGGDHGPGGPGKGRPELTDAQKSCLTSNGVTLPTPPAQGSASNTNTKPTAPTAEQKAAFDAAAKACNLPTRPAKGSSNDNSGKAIGAQSSNGSNTTNTVKAAA